jgi:hypothetical protein
MQEAETLPIYNSRIIFQFLLKHRPRDEIQCRQSGHTNKSTAQNTKSLAQTWQTLAT